MSEKRPTIYAIDFDGTICTNKWPEIGEPIQDIVNYILDIQERGDQWILYTMREGEKLDEAMSWLALRGLHPDAVNDNLPQMKAFYGNNPRKVFANYYIDDHNACGLILPPLFGVWNMFLMRTYFKAISPSLYDAAKIDGAGHWTIFFRIALPLSITALLTVGLMYALSYWNDWWHALMFIDDRDLYPLQYYLYSIVSNVNAVSSGRVPSGAAANIRLPAETVKIAVTIITIGPIIFLYPFIQRYFVKGIMMGAVKE